MPGGSVVLNRNSVVINLTLPRRNLPWLDLAEGSLSLNRSNASSFGVVIGGEAAHNPASLKRVKHAGA